MLALRNLSCCFMTTCAMSCESRGVCFHCFDACSGASRTWGRLAPRCTARWWAGDRATKALAAAAQLRKRTQAGGASASAAAAGATAAARLARRGGGPRTSGWRRRTALTPRISTSAMRSPSRLSSFEMYSNICRHGGRAAASGAPAGAREGRRMQTAAVSHGGPHAGPRVAAPHNQGASRTLPSSTLPNRPRCGSCPGSRGTALPPCAGAGGVAGRAGGAATARTERLVRLRERGAQLNREGFSWHAEQRGCPAGMRGRSARDLRAKSSLGRARPSLLLGQHGCVALITAVERRELPASGRWVVVDRAARPVSLNDPVQE
jgi:hypothetical protein